MNISPLYIDGGDFMQKITNVSALVPCAGNKLPVVPIHADSETSRESANEFVHDFHLKMDVDLIERFEAACGLLGKFLGVAGFLGMLFDEFPMLLEREHFAAPEHDGEYLLINPNLEVKRRSVHIYFSKVTFRRFKMVHQDLNYFSMAQIVRRLAEIIINLAKKYGVRLLNYLKKVKAAWLKKCRQAKDAHCPIWRAQLSSFKYRVPGGGAEFGHQTEYDNYFSP